MLEEGDEEECWGSELRRNVGGGSRGRNVGGVSQGRKVRRGSRRKLGRVFDKVGGVAVGVVIVVALLKILG